MAENADEMLFPINGEPWRGFYAGSLPQDRQALITLSDADEVVVVVFGPQGELLHVIQEPLASPPVLPDDEQFQEFLKQKFGFRPGQIRVRAFRLPGDELAVYRLPKKYQNYLRDPNDPEFDMEEREAFPTWIEDWEREGWFVLDVGPCNYWLDQTGEVIAS